MRRLTKTRQPGVPGAPAPPAAVSLLLLARMGMLIVQMSQARTRWVAGCMTGTSLDGLDAALVEVEGSGLEVRATLHGMVSVSLGDLAPVLRRFASGAPAAPLDYLRAARQLGQLHAQTVADLCARHAPNRQLDLVVAHGQTICHAPPKAPPNAQPVPGLGPMSLRAEPGLSWQLFDPWPLVRRLAVPVCYDLRQADLSAGGQGAPLTPLADWVLYRDAAKTRAVVNLGGICNLTILPAGATSETIDGYDAGPCNLLIDAVVQALFPDRVFDQDGALAAAGRAGDCFVEALGEHPWWQQRRLRRQSTGREDFSADWVRQTIAQKCAGLAPADIVASAVGAVAGMVAIEAQTGGAAQVILAGGGSLNRTLVARIRSLCAPWAEVLLSDELGIPVAAREAVAFAVLGALSQDGVPITLPQVTGASKPGCAGAWVYP
jgi:1,6-anhydro-N-acetylmuramate kinase